MMRARDVGATKRATTSLLLCILLSSRVSTAFTPPMSRTTRSFFTSYDNISGRSSSSSAASLPLLQQQKLHESSPTLLRVASVDSSESTRVMDFESLKGEDGIYDIADGDQHKAFLKENSDKLVILKVFAPWCRACKGLAPKYQKIANDEDYKDQPMVFSSMSIQNNKDYIKSIGVLALPTIQMYKNGQLVDNFPCGPSKVPILKRKLADLVERSVDPTTGEVMAGTAKTGDDIVAEKPAGTPPVAPSVQGEDATLTDTTTSDADGGVKHEYLTNDQIQHIRTQVPFFENLSDDDFDSSLRSAKILTFAADSIIMREGNPGNTFYVILEGTVEICQRTAFEDPLIAPSDYIGTVINRLKDGDWFGERALITGEPRAASIRVAAPPDNLRVVAFNKEDLPPSCVLSGKPVATSDLEERINDKYGLTMKELDDLETRKQIKESYLTNQKRGSANSPQILPGVDTDEDVSLDGLDETDDDSLAMLSAKTASIIPLLEKFKLIRSISRCFDYIVKSGAEWGNPAVRRRRSLLASRLPRSQREEFVEAFELVDTNKDGGINLNELRSVLETIGEDKADDDLVEMIPQGLGKGMDGEDIMTLQDFIGIMAEVEFYYLFRDVFATLDKRDVGFVKAADLDRLLSGVRDLVSDDRHSIIDVEDKEMMIDYEQFTKMLLGLSL